MKLALFIGLYVYGPIERPINIGSETYFVKMRPLACDSPKVACGTPLLPRRYRGEVFDAKGKKVGAFDRPCWGNVCAGLEATVVRAIENVSKCEREAK